MQPMRGFDTRRLTPTDLPALLALEQRVYPFPWAQCHFEDCFKAHYEAWLLVDRTTSVLAGYLILSFVLDEANLLNLCVNPDYQRRGLGEALLNWATTQAERRSCTSLWLEVRESNQAAQALYRKQGFVEQGRRKGYYPSAAGREDALILALPLAFDFSGG